MVRIAFTPLARIDTRSLHVHRPDSGENPTLGGMAVSHDRATLLLIEQVGMRAYVRINLDLQGGLQQPTGSLSGNFGDLPEMG